MCYSATKFITCDVEQQMIFAQKQLKIKYEKLHILNNKIKKKKEELKRLEKLESNIVRTLSNELKSPLNIMMGYSQMLMRQHFGKLNSQQIKVVEKIFDSGESLSRSLNRILDISQLEANSLYLDSKIFNLNHLIREIIDHLTPQATAKNISLQIVCQLEQSSILGDRDRWRQILLELISNGINFTEEGEVSVKIAESSRGWITIEVKDSGIGIAADCLDRIFNKFWQADLSLERQYQSLGIGLSLIKALVEKMQGTITVESQIDLGSTFYVQLPRT